jgi:hypothetical protein
VRATGRSAPSRRSLRVRALGQSPSQPATEETMEPRPLDLRPSEPTRRQRPHKLSERRIPAFAPISLPKFHQRAKLRATARLACGFAAA